MGDENAVIPTDESSYIQNLILDIEKKLKDIEEFSTKFDELIYNWQQLGEGIKSIKANVADKNNCNGNEEVNRKLRIISLEKNHESVEVVINYGLQKFEQLVGKAIPEKEKIVYSNQIVDLKSQLEKSTQENNILRAENERLKQLRNNNNVSGETMRDEEPTSSQRSSRDEEPTSSKQGSRRGIPMNLRQT